MADPKIKYDIEAAVSGSADVIALANNVEKLAGSLDGDLKAKALAAADSLRELGRQDAVLSQFAALRASVEKTNQDFAAAQRAVTGLNSAITAVGAPTRAQAGQLQKLGDVAKTLENELGRDSVALERLRANLSASGISASNFVNEQVRVKNALAGATVEANKVVGVNKEVAKSYDGVASSLGTLKSQVAGLVGVNIGAGMVKDVLATADAFNNLQARIKISTGEGAAFTQSFKEVSEIALRTGANLEQTGILFTKLVESGKSGGLTLEAAIGQSLRLTEIISQASLIGSSSAESSRAAINQLNQSLASGVLRGDEFNSVMEQAPRISKAMADGLGVTVGQLRAMAEAGALTSDVVIKALKNQADVIQKEFATLPLTVGRSVEKLQTQWALYISDLDKGNGITAKVAKGLDLLANNLNGVINTVTTGVAGYAGYVAVNKLLGDGATIAAAKVTTQAVASAEAAVATRAHGAAAGVAGAQVAGYGAAATAAGAQVAAGSAAGSAAAVGGFRAAAAGVVGFISKLGLIGVAAFAGYEAIKLVASGADQLLRKYSGLNAAEEKLAASEKAYTDALKANAIALENQNLAKQEAINKTFGLTVASVALVAKFDDLVKKGDSAAEAIGKIGKDFDLASVPGIQSAGSVLDKLLADGKITATQFQHAWSDALKSVDLAEFETKARVAFANTARGAGELQQALDAGVREAIKRTGLDFEVISGGMGKAARSAINDTDAIIKGLDNLKAKGVDTGQALTASLSKGISTADSVKALEVVKSQIEQVRKALGDKVADGLLDQAKVKALELADALDKAKPGVQSLREAMKELGLTSREELQATADKAKVAYDTIISKGQQEGESYVVWQARKTDAVTEFLKRAIAANGGIAPEWVKTQAAIEGVTIAVDANGKATVENASKSKQAVSEVAAAFDAVAVAANKAALAAVNAKYSRPGEDPVGAKAADDARSNKLSGQNFVDNSFQFLAKDALDRGKLDELDPKVLAEFVRTMRINERIDEDVTRNNPAFATPEAYASMREWKVVVSRIANYLDILKAQSSNNIGNNANANTTQNTNTNTGNTNTSNAGANTSSGGSAKVVNIQIGGSSYPVQTNAQGADNLIKALQIGARNAGY